MNSTRFLTPSAEIVHLRAEIEHHNDLYYQQAAPEISDFEFDRLLERLKAARGRTSGTA